MIYVSTSCLRGKKPISEIIKEFAINGIKNIELGSSHQFEDNIEDFILSIQKKYDLNFTIHAYFPPEKDSFFVNLASQKQEILQRSIIHIKNMIDFGVKINARSCSFHSGFRFDPTNGAKFNGMEIYPYDKSYNTFLDSVIKICQYADFKKINICFEPNVLSKNNLIENQNKLLLMVEYHEIERLFQDLEKNDIQNLKILLDLGHLKVSANNLNFDPNNFIINTLPKIIELHIHENEGYFDQHDSLKDDGDIVHFLKKYPFHSSVIYTLESKNLNIMEIEEHIDLISKIVTKNQKNTFKSVD